MNKTHKKYNINQFTNANYLTISMSDSLNC